MNMEDHVMQSTDYPSTLLRGLSQLYSRNALVDCRLSFQDGESLLAHKCILAAASKYLKVQIEKGAVSSGVLMIRSVSSVEFGALLHFMYTGELKLNPDSVWDITSAAAILDMPDALKLCREFVEIGGGLVSQEEQTEEEKPELSVQDQAWQGNQLITVRRRGRPKRESKSMAKKLKDQKEFDVVPDVAVKVEVVDENLFNREDNGESSTMNYDEATDGISEECGVDDDDLNDNTYTPPAVKKLKKTSKEKSNSPKKNRKKATKLMKPEQNVEAGTSSKKFTSIKVKSKRKGKTDSSKVQMPLVPYPKHECHLCSYKFFHYSSLQLHLRQHKVSPLFLRTLQLCTRKYQKMRFRTDANTTLKTVLYKCRRCCESFAKRVDCVKHINSLCKQTRILTCRLCKRKFSSGRDLMMHRISSHSKVKNKLSSSVTLKDRANPDIQQCDVCFKIFLHHANFTRHLKAAHNIEREGAQRSGLYYCRHCQSFLTSKKRYITHLSGHQLSQREINLEFYAVYLAQIQLEADEDIVEGILKLMNSQSEIDVDKPKNLESSKILKILVEVFSVYKTKKDVIINGQSKLLHNTKACKFLKCSYCDYQTPHPSNLKRHELIHTGKRVHCPQCSKPFKQKSELRQHIKVIHDNQPYVCSICSKKFVSKAGLSGHHQMLHLKTEKYKCEICEKAFFFKPHYIGHMNTHLEDKKVFPCLTPGCKRKYVYKSSLNQHSKSCKGPKAPKPESKCEICCVVMSSEHALRDHIAGAHGNKFYECHCGKFFRWRGSFYNHKKKCNSARSFPN